MITEDLKTKKGIYEAKVSFNRSIGARFYRLGLTFTAEGAAAFAKAQPGQFAQIDLAEKKLPADIPDDLVDISIREILLRRPFSFCNITTKDNKTKVEILYQTVGPATLRMSALKKRDTISVLGPLGNGFTIPENKKTAYLIVGGMGAGPLLHLAKQLTAQRIDINVTAFAGAKSSLDLPFHGRVEELNQQLGYPIREFAMFAIASFVATDDGTAGFHGFVTDCFTQWLKQNKPKSAEAVIYTCGPEIMLEQVAKIAKENNIDCQVSMEGRMACGIGICQGCAIGCKTENSDETTYKMCCKDGPVFNSKEIYG